nr:hypothetical protein Itr_chr05CG10230 [Ipomoea trifida]
MPRTPNHLTLPPLPRASATVPFYRRRSPTIDLTRPPLTLVTHVHAPPQTVGASLPSIAILSFPEFAQSLFFAPSPDASTAITTRANPFAAIANTVAA